jgi:drug/metabolite transporter (DMT)-like permease
VAALPTTTVVLGRVGLAALALNLYLILLGQRLPTGWADWRAFIVMGLLNNVIPFSLIAWGEIRIASGLASILNATTPIFTVLAAHWLTANERLTPAKAAGVALGFTGAAVLIGNDALAGLGGADLTGEFACLLAALVYAFAGIYGRRFKGMNPIHAATGQVTGSTLVLAPLAAAIDRPWLLPAPGLEIWAAFLGTAILCTALGYVLYFRILAAAGATNLLLVTLLLPVSALLLGWAFLGESIGARAPIGMALIAAGLAAIDGRAIGWLTRPAEPSLPAAGSKPQ